MKPLHQGGANPMAEDWAALHVTWDRRTQLAAEWLQDARAVADIGCGLMGLEAMLPKATKYVSMDVVPRDSRTLALDLDREPIPAVHCDAMVLLGVLEYLGDVSAVLR